MDKKMCPLLTTNPYSCGGWACEEDRCMWWIPKEKIETGTIEGHCVITERLGRINYE